jgi:hypothetical protein
MFFKFYTIIPFTFKTAVGCVGSVVVLPSQNQPRLMNGCRSTFSCSTTNAKVVERAIIIVNNKYKPPHRQFHDALPTTQNEYTDQPRHAHILKITSVEYGLI